MALILTANGSSHSETSLTREKSLTCSEIRDIERRLQRLNVIQTVLKGKRRSMSSYVRRV